MGFPSFPALSGGFLLIINTALCIASLKDILRFLLQILGLNSITSTSTNAQPQPQVRRETPRSSYPSESQTPVLGSGFAQLPLIAEEIRESLPVSLYGNGSPINTNAHVECAVCLSRVEEGDEIRRLPCCHFFHRLCLDKWIDHQQTTCPLCRSSLVPEEIANKLRRREQELSEELIFWFTSFYGNGFHSMWWLR
eukprot:Gb_29602 [translate_table: standard]